MQDFLWRLRAFGVEFKEWLVEIRIYAHARLLNFAIGFEHTKDGLVDLLTVSYTHLTLPTKRIV